MDIPILETKGLDEEGVIKPNIILQNNKPLPNHITLAVMLFDNKPDPKILADCEPLFRFVAASSILQQYVYKNKIVLSYAPLGGAAAGGLLEELIAFGIKKVIACGSSGLIGDFDTKKFLLVDKAIRDEGLSYHYMKPSTYAETNPNLNQTLKTEFAKRTVLYEMGTTWTTDAFYRETKTRIGLRKAQGAIAVEMECASLAAVATYRKIEFAQLLYFSDIVSQDIWSGFTEERNKIKLAVNKLILDVALSIAHQTKEES